MQQVMPRHALDRTGKSITTYVLFDVAEQLTAMFPGDVLEVVTDDFEPFCHDVAAFCAANGHRLVASEAIPAGRRFLIEKGTPPETTRSVAMVISDPGLLELLSPLGFALAAALEGMEVSLYFQGPAVRLFAPGYRPRLKGLMRPFTRFAARQISETGHIAAVEKLRQLERLGARFYLCGGSVQRFSVDAKHVIFDDVPIVEYLTFAPIMAAADVSLYI